MVSFEIPKRAKMGFAIRAEVEPVAANTTSIIMTCQSDVMFQRSLKLLIFLNIVQIYSIYGRGTNPASCCL